MKELLNKCFFSLPTKVSNLTFSLKAYFITGICLADPGDITTISFAIFTGPNKVLLKYITT
jgi:hypothetical protein